MCVCVGGGGRGGSGVGGWVGGWWYTQSRSLSPPDTHIHTAYTIRECRVRVTIGDSCLRLLRYNAVISTSTSSDKQ